MADPAYEWFSPHGISFPSLPACVVAFHASSTAWPAYIRVLPPVSQLSRPASQLSMPVFVRDASGIPEALHIPVDHNSDGGLDEPPHLDQGGTTRGRGRRKNQVEVDLRIPRLPAPNLCSPKEPDLRNLSRSHSRSEGGGRAFRRAPKRLN